MVKNDSPRITVGFSTLAARGGGCEMSFSGNDIEVLLVVQGGEIKSKQPHVRVIYTSSFGLSASRNCVIESASGRYILFADDDCVVLTERLASVVEYFENNPEIGLIAARSEDFSGNLRKKFPSRIKFLNKWNSGRIGSIEIVVDRIRLLDAGVRFDTAFGLGSHNYMGEEYIFITDLLKKGIKAVFLPVTIVRHEQESTGSLFGFESDLRVRLAVLDRVFGCSAPLIRLVFALKHIRKFHSFRLALAFIFGRLG